MSGRNICRMAIYYLLGIVSILYWDSHRGYIIAAWLACIICMWWHIHSKLKNGVNIQSDLKFGLNMQSRMSHGFVRSARFTVGINIVCALIGAFTAYKTQAQYNTYDELLTDGMYVTFQGEIYKKEVKSNGLIYYMQDVYLQSDHFLLDDSSGLDNSNGLDIHNESSDSIELSISNGVNEISCSKIIICLDSDIYPIGTICIGRGQVKTFSTSRNDGNFDERQYYNSLGIATRLEKCTLEDLFSLIEFENCESLVCNNEEIFSFHRFFCDIKEFLWDLRCDISQVYEEYLPGEEAGIMSTIALGDKGNLDPEAKELFQMSGIAHLLSVSGLHISVVAMSLYNFLRRRRLGFAISGVVSVAVLGLYANMVGMGLPVRRAFIMYVIYIVGMMLGEAYDSLTALAIAGMIMMIENPLVVMNVGFVFSFSAVIGVVTYASQLKKVYESWWLKLLEKRNIRKQEQPKMYKLIHRVLGALAFSVGVTLATIPIVGHMYYEIPVYSMILNFLLLPLMPALLGFGLLGGLVDWFIVWLITFSGTSLTTIAAAGAMTSVSSVLTRIIMLPTHLILYLYEMVADWSLKLPGARQIVGCIPIWKMAAYYLLLYVLIYRVLPQFLERKGESEGKWNFKVRVKKKARSNSKLWLKLIAALITMGALLLPAQADIEIDMLDCGQGDAIYISNGCGVNCFVDGGSTSIKNVGKYRMLPFLKYRGVRRIDYWFISHTDEDHISGLREAIEDGYDIRHILFSEGMELKDLGELAKEHGIDVQFISQGDQVVTESVTFTCLYPSRESGFEGPNENSMVLLMEYGDFQAIFTGDIGADQEAWMLNDDYAREKLLSAWENTYDGQESSAGEDEISAKMEKPKISGVELLKVPHHGSKYSNSREFLELIAPHYSIISAGEKNRYGHPSKDAIARMDELGLSHYCTIDYGQISVIPDKSGDCRVKSILRILNN